MLQRVAEARALPSGQAVAEMRALAAGQEAAAEDDLASVFVVAVTALSPLL